ncbi:hypothetical protein [Streptomyces sp. H27-C3]|uniref:hypothetical protein n=1 Tax=Streptomyces sp. H27-C3 TaxID=3046305 RepID=UPI0024BBA43E|nr:hypothetical protein [Streptomyces sp. H27-C3]MDJ0467026.1 hypothetical protein [Streptomyces sp. H27-C3]
MSSTVRPSTGVSRYTSSRNSIVSAGSPSSCHFASARASLSAVSPTSWPRAAPIARSLSRTVSSAGPRSSSATT